MCKIEKQIIEVIFMDLKIVKLISKHLTAT